ncbi:hypothetical protein PHPALM_27613 [Phytophthora palmivora]|uniref:Uncharacterized protein n=1 Tax=Phytophthora palmivora TaxID=4796 RepID=A0A2P4XC56_9STRA|nr:hypothetical protein PHPALM_27613 [Phytophthora palmivora]
MSDIAVLGRTYVLRLRTAGLRSVRSPSGSSIGEPSSKRPQHHPPRPEDMLASLPSQLPSSGTSTRDDASRGTTSDPVPSLVGTSDVSSLEVTSGSAGSYVSRNSSSSSAASAFGHSALTHMPSVGYGTMAMTVQGPSVSAVEGGETGFQLIHQDTSGLVTLPDQQDVTMTEIASEATQPEVTPRVQTEGVTW